MCKSDCLDTFIRNLEAEWVKNTMRQRKKPIQMSRSFHNSFRYLCFVPFKGVEEMAVE